MPRPTNNRPAAMTRIISRRGSVFARSRYSKLTTWTRVASTAATITVVIRALLPPRCPQGNPTALFRYRETTDFDCHRVERTRFWAQLAPAEVQRLFSAHFIANTRL